MTARISAVLVIWAASAALAAAPQAAASAARPRAIPQPGMIDRSLIEDVNAIDEPNLVAVFAYVPLTNQPAALAELLTRDHRGLKRYADKLNRDMQASGGVTDWDHEVCAVLVNRFETVSDRSGLPDKKRMSIINECILSRVVPFAELMIKRNR